MNWYYHARVGLDIKFFWKEILSFIPALMPTILAGILMVRYLSLDSILHFIGLGIIYIIIFCVSMWFIGMNQYEKDLIGKPIKRIISRVIK
jgi:ABC-type Na+ efflux pump permease subunit